MENFLEKKIKKVCRNLFITWILGFFIAVFLIYLFNEESFYYIFNRPIPLSAKKLDKIQVSGRIPTSPVKLKIKAIHQLNLDELKNYEFFKDSLEGNYYLTKIKDKMLIITTNGKLSPDTEIKGKLTTDIPSVIETILITLKKQKGIDSYPFMLDTGANSFGNYIPLIIIIILAIVLLKILSYLTKYIKDPKSHKVYKKIANWGDIIAINNQIKQEMKNKKFKISNYIFTENYLIKNKTLSFNVFRWEDLVWAYHKKTVHRLYYVIPIGVSHSAILIFNREENEIKTSKKKVEKIINYANERNPIAIIGYSDELKSLYNSDYNAFLALLQLKAEEQENNNNKEKKPGEV